MVIDIEHLHDVIEGKIVGRGCGSSFAVKTQAVCAADLLSEVEKCYLLVVVPVASMVKDYKDDMFRIANSMGVYAWRSNAYSPCLIIQGKYDVIIDIVDPQKIMNRLPGSRYENFYIDPACILTQEQINKIETRIGK